MDNNWKIKSGSNTKDNPYIIDKGNGIELYSWKEDNSLYMYQVNTITGERTEAECVATLVEEPISFKANNYNPFKRRKR